MSRSSSPTAVVIGAGHAGLAASGFLAERGVDHVVLERGEVANSWRRERWDSLRLLTPRSLSGLPGHPCAGADPDGYMGAGEVADFIGGYARALDAPVRTGTTVTSVRRTDGGYRVDTDQGGFDTRAVVIASGAANRSAVPALSAGLPADVTQVTAWDYKRPDDLPDGGVLVVGASASGVQLAAEIHRSGRPVTLSTGEHVRMPRLYRGRDVLWWMDATGVWGQRADEVPDLDRARELASPQLAGTPDRSTLDINALTAAGVGLVGRVAAVRGGELLFSGGLRNVLSLADLKMNRLLAGFDEWAERAGVDAKPPERFDPTRVPASTRLRLDLGSGEIRTVVWATGYRPDYSWLDVPVVDAKGRLVHTGGVVDSPGLYALALPVLRRRASTFLHGIGPDAREVTDHLVGHLAGRGR